MADDKAPEEHPLSMVFFIVGGLAILITFWYLNGGAQYADLRGIFLAPPAPLGSGDAYGPQIGSSTPTTTQQTAPQYQTDSFYQAPTY